MNLTPEELDAQFRVLPKEEIKEAIFSGEDGIFYAYGHIDPETMCRDVELLDSYYTGHPSVLNVTEQDVKHGYARINKLEVDADGDEEVYFITCSKDDPEAFPITTWNF